MNMKISFLRQQYLSQKLTPRELIKNINQRAVEFCDYNIWIHLLSESEIAPYLEKLENIPPKDLPLYGVPFAIKDNIDLQEITTTAACREYAYTPNESAYVVRKLIEAGAIPIGKTNMDQFATGLVGTRSPYGACKNSINQEYISGGSSSGSAVSVALELVSFALGTDTAGSGRVPAAFNDLVGFKPTKGLLSTRGVVPACRSLDCVTLLSKTVEDIDVLFEIVNSYDGDDIYSRNYKKCDKKVKKTIAIPRSEDLEFFGDHEAKKLFETAVSSFQKYGYSVSRIDFTPFLESADLLYNGPWVSERYIAIQEIMQNRPEILNDTTRTIISKGQQKSGIEYFQSEYQLKAYKKIVDMYLEQFDFIVTPTTGTIYKIAEVEANPIMLNTNLGYYTNFMNLLDFCAIALPAGFRGNTLPFGITIFSQAFDEEHLLESAKVYMGGYDANR